MRSVNPIVIIKTPIQKANKITKLVRCKLTLFLKSNFFIEKTTE